MDPGEIWQTIVKADELLKYATEEKGAVRREQAERLLRQALEEARAVNNDALVQQAETRLRDLGVADA
jgi:hypothetical protein